MAHSQSSTKTQLKPTRVLLVDDHPIVRERLAEIINGEKDLMVCAEAEDRHGAIKAVETAKPALALIDLALRNSSGLELIKDLHTRWPRLIILVVSMQEESLYAERVLRAGARGYYRKTSRCKRGLANLNREFSQSILITTRVAPVNGIIFRIEVFVHSRCKIIATPGVFRVRVNGLRSKISGGFEGGRKKFPDAIFWPCHRPCRRAHRPGQERAEQQMQKP
jgi:CheY-like chemotaxis protein